MVTVVSVNSFVEEFIGNEEEWRVGCGRHRSVVHVKSLRKIEQRRGERTRMDLCHVRTCVYRRERPMEEYMWK